jgi:hypothetical protein
MSTRRRLLIGSVVVLVIMFAAASVFAASTQKQLSTNFTLVNLGTSTAYVQVSYLLNTGATWTAPAASTTFTLTANGGQKIIRQYSDVMTPSSGKGSAIVSSDQPLGAVVQIQARSPQVPTNGAYKGYNQGSSTFYMPLILRRGSSASGTTNTQLAIQNTDSAAVTVDVKFLGGNVSSNNYTKTVSIAPGVTYYYDLDDENSLNAPWNGSAVVAAQGGGKIAVVANFFTGADTLQTYNGFSGESANTGWVLPLFTSRLGNGLSSVVRVQNVSGADIAVGGITINCTRNNATAPTTLTFTNTAMIVANKSYEVNPVTNTSIPASWQGSCTVDTLSSNTVALVQMRYVGGTGNPGDAAAYEGLNADGTDTKVVVPLVAKRLSNGFATVVNIQNLDTANPASVTLVYKHKSNPALDLTTTKSIPAGASIQENQRLSAFSVGATVMPDSWEGSLTVTSTGAPIDAIVQLTYVNSTVGDTFQAHGAFTLP